MSKIFPSYHLVYNCLSAEACDSIIQHCETKETKLATLNGVTDMTKILQKRFSYINFHNDEDVFIKSVIQEIDDLIRHIIDRYSFDIKTPNYFQYSTYTEKGFFDWHCDLIMDKPSDKKELMRKVSVVILLNDDFTGGEFETNKGNPKFPTKHNLTKGDAIIFPSFVSHRVKPIVSGTRKSLVLWYGGADFK